MSANLLQISPAPPGFWAIYECDGRTVKVPIVCLALNEDEGETWITPMVCSFFGYLDDARRMPGFSGIIGPDGFVRNRVTWLAGEVEILPQEVRDDEK